MQKDLGNGELNPGPPRAVLDELMTGGNSSH